jgi:LmbE family N-acetylglucosaminyl deacetylase
VLPLQLAVPTARPLSLLAIGAHPDDIEIGAGGTLLSFCERIPGLEVRYVVLTGTADRQMEARQAAREFLAGADVTVRLYDLPEGRLPAVWADAKDLLEQEAQTCTPDVILAPWRGDAHQDHRTIGEIVPTVFRDRLHLGYEIPKWDGDIGRPSAYVPLPPGTARRKVELLHKSFPSQRGREWWDDEVFLGIARLRGVECRAQYAEAFHCAKSVLALPAPALGGAGHGSSG